MFDDAFLMGEIALVGSFFVFGGLCEVLMIFGPIAVAQDGGAIVVGRSVLHLLGIIRASAIIIENH